MKEKSIKLMIGEDGTATEYDDTFDITIHCRNREEQKKAIEIINSRIWTRPSEKVPRSGEMVIAQISGKAGCCIFTHAVVLGEYYEGEGWFFEAVGDRDNKAVIQVEGWMELPEPFVPEETENE